jgi:hypothetical protein
MEFVDVLVEAVGIWQPHVIYRTAVNIRNAVPWRRYATQFLNHPSQLCRQRCFRSWTALDPPLYQHVSLDPFHRNIRGTFVGECTIEIRNWD